MTMLSALLTLTALTAPTRVAAGTRVVARDTPAYRVLRTGKQVDPPVISVTPRCAPLVLIAVSLLCDGRPRANKAFAAVARLERE